MAWFFSIFYVIGLAVVGVALRRRRRAMATRSWPSVIGTITANELRHRLEMADETFVAVVEYVYRVGDQAFRAGRIAYDYDESDHRESHRGVHERVPIGARVRVYHDPNQPSEAALVRGVTEGSTSLLAFGVWWMLFTAGVHRFQVQIDGHPELVPWAPIAWLISATFALVYVLVRGRRRECNLAASIEVIPDPPS